MAIARGEQQESSPGLEGDGHIKKKKFVSQCSEGRIETLVIFKGLSTLTLSFFFSSFLIPSPAV